MWCISEKLSGSTKFSLYILFETNSPLAEKGKSATRGTISLKPPCVNAESNAMGYIEIFLSSCDWMNLALDSSRFMYCEFQFVS